MNKHWIYLYLFDRNPWFIFIYSDCIEDNIILTKQDSTVYYVNHQAVKAAPLNTNIHLQEIFSLTLLIFFHPAESKIVKTESHMTSTKWSIGRLCRLKLFNYQISSRTEFLNLAQTNLELLDPKWTRVFRQHSYSICIIVMIYTEGRDAFIYSCLRESSL